MDEREEGARAICATLRNAGFEALFAGGCVRDRILGLVPRDYDIATSARVSEVAALFPRTVAVGAAFGVTRVLLEQGEYEVAAFRSDGPYLDGRHPSSVAFVDAREDARRRDFTINALFYDPARERVIDYVSGERDIAAGVLRAVGDPAERFGEDHLRLLRAVRFAARLDYTIAPETAAAMARLAPRAIDTSAERIRDELTKILLEGGARRAFAVMDETGILGHVLPEVAAMKGVEQPRGFHPEGDVFVHTMLMLEALDRPSATLAMAALLHDVGKPRTQTFEDRIRFNNHHKVGARMAERICHRLRFPNAQAERIVWLVEQHMRLMHICDMAESKRKRFAREPGFDELVELGRLDCLASHGDTSSVDWIAQYKAELRPEQARPEPLLRGGDLIRMDYVPGPLFSEILRAVEDGQLEGELSTREGAADMVRRRWPLPDGGSV